MAFLALGAVELLELFEGGALVGELLGEGAAVESGLASVAGAAPEAIGGVEAAVGEEGGAIVRGLRSVGNRFGNEAADFIENPSVKRIVKRVNNINAIHKAAKNLKDGKDGIPKAILEGVVGKFLGFDPIDELLFGSAVDFVEGLYVTSKDKDETYDRPMTNKGHRAPGPPPNSHLPYAIHHGARTHDTHEYHGHQRSPDGEIIPYFRLNMGSAPPDVDLSETGQAHLGHGGIQEFQKNPQVMHHTSEVLHRPKKARTLKTPVGIPKSSIRKQTPQRTHPTPILRGQPEKMTFLDKMNVGLGNPFAQVAKMPPKKPINGHHFGDRIVGAYERLRHGGLGTHK